MRSSLLYALLTLLPGWITPAWTRYRVRGHSHTYSLGLWVAGGQWFPPSVVLRASALPGHLLECKFLGLIQHLLNLRLWEWGPAICALTSPPGDSDAHLNLRTTALGASV